MGRCSAVEAPDKCGRNLDFSHKPLKILDFRPLRVPLKQKSCRGGAEPRFSGRSRLCKMRPLTVTQVTISPSRPPKVPNSAISVSRPAQSSKFAELSRSGSTKFQIQRIFPASKRKFQIQPNFKWDRWTCPTNLSHYLSHCSEFNLPLESKTSN